MDLEPALAFSAYADRAFTAEPALRGELDATLACGVRLDGGDQVLDAIVAGGDVPCACPRAARDCAGASSCIRWPAT